jgi:predicted transposase YdaD
MPYVTSFERLARKEGRQEGRQEGRKEAILDILETRFGDVPTTVRERINALCDESKLKEFLRRASVIPSLEEF